MLRQTDTTGVNHFDLRRAWDGTVIFKAFAPEDEDEDENDDSGGGDTGDDTGDGDGSSGTDADDKSKDKVRDPEAKDRSNEAAKYRRRLRETEQAKNDLEKRLRDIEDKDKSENDVLKRDNDELKAQVSTLTDRAVKAERNLAFITSGAANLVGDAELALSQLDLKDLEPDDDGNFDAKEIIRRTEDLLKRKPILKRTEDNSGEGNGTPSGQPSNRRKGDKEDADKAALQKKFPALARR